MEEHRPDNSSDREVVANSTHPDTSRDFCGRASAYKATRPSYPQEALDWIRRDLNLPSDAVLVDVGAGTGIMSRHLVDLGYSVIVTEPNEDMLSQARVHLEGARSVQFRCVSAEALGLPDNSVAAVVCAQSFHFFDKTKVSREFSRVLQEGGKAVLIWNAFDFNAPGILPPMVELLRSYIGDNSNLRPARFVEQQSLDTFLERGTLREKQVEFSEWYQKEKFLGFVLSFSYVPSRESAQGLSLERDLNNLFDTFATDDGVSIAYCCSVFSGKLAQQM